MAVAPKEATQETVMMMFRMSSRSGASERCL
jgi:hypothetical protein